MWPWQQEGRIEERCQSSYIVVDRHQPEIGRDVENIADLQEELGVVEWVGEMGGK